MVRVFHGPINERQLGPEILYREEGAAQNLPAVPVVTEGAESYLIE
jgi:hypothetical protein